MGRTTVGWRAYPRADGYRRATPGAIFEIQLLPEASGIGQYVYVTTKIVIPGRDRHPLLVRLYPHDAWMLLNHAGLAQAQGLTWPGADDGPACMTHVETRAELQTLAAHWARLFEAAVWPLLARCATLEGLEREVNGGHRSAFMLAPLALSLAAAVGRVDLEAVAAEVRSAVSPAQQPNVDRLRERLREAGFWPAT